MSHDEYDAFGPWIDEVTTEQGLPRLYRDHPIDFARTRLVLKVPRNIARRDANPSMHLYDALVIVAPEELTLLHRDGDRYTVRTIPYTSVFALQDSVVLLDGRFAVHVVDGPPVSIAYNGSAQETTKRLLALLQTLASPMHDRAGRGDDGAGESARSVVERVLGGDADYGVRGDCLALLAEEADARVLAGHPTTPVVPRPGLLVSLAHRFRPAHLQGGVLMETPSALVLLHRRDWIRRGGDHDLSHATTVLLPERITQAVRRPHPLYEEVEVLRVGTPASAVDLVIPADSPIGRGMVTGRAPIVA
jgi:hypothetical protein